MFMKKVLFVFAIAMLSFGAVNAQESAAGGFHFGGGLRFALPLGDMADGSSFGIGAELQGEYMFSDMVSGTFTTGYTSFLGKTVEGVKSPSSGYIPILAGIRVYPSPTFFIGAKAGYGIVTVSGFGSSGAFNYEPQIGYNGTKIQLALGYNGLSQTGGTSSHMALSAIYKFN
jgi:hypothetical protein